MGTGTNVSREQIETLPSANRNIQDYIRLDPRISQVSKADGAISAGGQNTRYNAIRIDGVSAGDPFGLERNNLPTERQPVSMDAIEAINIDLANYDTTITGGTGANINAVTKSGTNEFHGSVYYTYRDKDMVRKDLRRRRIQRLQRRADLRRHLRRPDHQGQAVLLRQLREVRAHRAGHQPDRHAVRQRRRSPMPTSRASRMPRRPTASTPASLALPASSKTETEEKAIKLDWNINDNHRAALRYNKFEQSVLRFPLIDSDQRVAELVAGTRCRRPTKPGSASCSATGATTSPPSSRSRTRTTTRSARRSPTCRRSRSRATAPTTASVYLGTEQNTHVNIVGTKEDSFFGAATWYAGDHTIKGGVDYSKQRHLQFLRPQPQRRLRVQQHRGLRGQHASQLPGARAAPGWRQLRRHPGQVHAQEHRPVPAGHLGGQLQPEPDVRRARRHARLQRAEAVQPADRADLRLRQHQHGRQTSWCSRAWASTTPSTASARPSCVAASACSAAQPRTSGWPARTRTPA